MKKRVSILLSVVLCLSLILGSAVSVNAEIKKKITIHPGYSVSLLDGGRDKGKWTSSNKKIATVSRGIVVSKKAGKAIITSKMKNDKNKTTIIVKGKDTYIKKISCDKTISAKTHQKESGYGCYHQSIPIDIFVQNPKHELEEIWVDFNLKKDLRHIVSYCAYEKNSEWAELDANYFEKIGDGHYRVYIGETIHRVNLNEKYILERITVRDTNGTNIHCYTRIQPYSYEYLNKNVSIVYQ